MDEAGVSRDVALRALRAAGPPHSPKKLSVTLCEGWWVTVSDGEWHSHEYIPPELGRRVINRLIERFKVPKIWFYEPLHIPGEEEKRPPS